MALVIVSKVKKAVINIVINDFGILVFMPKRFYIRRNVLLIA